MPAHPETTRGPTAKKLSGLATVSVTDHKGCTFLVNSGKMCGKALNISTREFSFGILPEDTSRFDSIGGIKVDKIAVLHIRQDGAKISAFQ